MHPISDGKEQLKASQDIIDSRTEFLSDRYHRLGFGTTDKSKLNALIAEAENELNGEYTNDSLYQLKKVLSDAKKTADDENVKQPAVDQMTEKLQAALNNLEQGGFSETLIPSGDLQGSGKWIQAGDFKASDIDTALDPYLYQIADEMLKYCKERKTVVFLPLVKTSQKFRDILISKGFNAAEVNGESTDRAEILEAFDKGEYNVLCNSMLLTEGWDCPSVDCVIVLRPTKVRGLYCQMVGRGTRLCEGKTELLLLDFLWHTERHELCRPAHLICQNEEVAEKMTENLANEAGCAVDIEEAEKQASEDVVAQREESLAKQLKEMKTRKRKLVDPLQYEMSIQAEDLSSYVPAFGWECAPATDKQKAKLEKLGIFPDDIDNAGKAKLILDRLEKRRNAGLTTPKQIRLLESKGFEHVGSWSFDSASRMIARISANGWRVPRDIDPKSYTPEN